MSDQEIYASFLEYLKTNTGFGTPDENLGMKMVMAGYTPEEAALLNGMSLQEEKTAEEWAELKKTDAGELSKELERLAKKGPVWRTAKDGKVTYKLNDPMFYFCRSLMWPGEYNEVAMEVAPLANQYMHLLSDKMPQYPIKGQSDDQFYQVPAHYVTIPIEGTVEDTREMLPYEDVVDMLENRWSYYSVSACVCAVRYELDTASHDCGYPLERCLHMDDLGRYIVDNGMGREVTLEEAKEIVTQAKEDGLFHSINPPTQEGFDTLCNCCPDCCFSMVYHHKFGNEFATIPSNYLIKDNPDECIGCGKCVEMCPMDCRRLRFQKGAKGRTTSGMAGYKKLGEEGGREVVFKNRSGKVAATDRNVCIGCGLCAYHCPTKCLTLEERKVKKTLPSNMPELVSWVQKAAEQK